MKVISSKIQKWNQKLISNVLGLFKKSKIQIQKFKDLKIQKFKDPKIQNLKNLNLDQFSIKF